MLLSVAPASIFDCASSMASSCAFIAVGGLICRPPTQTDMALFAVGVENKFVSAARLLMCELRGVGLHVRAAEVYWQLRYTRFERTSVSTRRVR